MFEAILFKCLRNKHLNAQSLGFYSRLLLEKSYEQDPKAEMHIRQVVAPGINFLFGLGCQNPKVLLFSVRLKPLLNFVYLWQ